MNRSESLTKWKARHAILVWLGIAMNLVYAIPLIFWPEWILGVFHIPSTPGLMIWTRFSAILLLILSVFYVPATLDIDRYRIFAWLAVFPSRTFGAVFFFLAVFLFGQPLGFLMGVLLDGTVAILTLWCLMRIVALEQEIAGGKA
jgi:hypothetical protein